MSRRTPVPRRLPVPTSAASAEREYFRLLRPYVDRYIALMQEGLDRLLPTLRATVVRAPDGRTDAQPRMDSNVERGLRALLASVGKQLATEYPDTTLARWAWVMVGNVNRNAKKNMERVAEKIGLAAEPLMRDNELSPFFRSVVEENVGLIKSIPASRLVAFKNQLVSAISRDATQADIRKMIQANFSATRNSARVIARDQTNKLNSSVDKYRQQQLGGTRYRWRGSKDGRERPDHLRLEGQVFLWSKPPITNRATGERNNPGQDIQCRCWAEMVLEDVVS